MFDAGGNVARFWLAVLNDFLLDLPGQRFSTKHRSRAQDRQDMARRFFRWNGGARKLQLDVAHKSCDMYDPVLGC